MSACVCVCPRDVCHATTLCMARSVPPRFCSPPPPAYHLWCIHKKRREKVREKTRESESLLGTILDNFLLNLYSTRRWLTRVWYVWLTCIYAYEMCTVTNTHLCCFVTAMRMCVWHVYSKQHSVWRAYDKWTHLCDWHAWFVRPHAGALQWCHRFAGRNSEKVS